MPWFQPSGPRKRLQLEWHVRFVPPGVKATAATKEFLKFREVEHLIRTRQLEVRRKAVDLRTRRQRQVLEIAQTALLLSGSAEAEKNASAKIKGMRIHSDAEKEAVFSDVKDLFEGQRKPSPGFSAKTSRHSVAAINRERRLLDKEIEVTDSVTELVRAAMKGDRNAAGHLKAIAEYATVQLGIASKTKPELFRPLAEKSGLWPVVASINPQWVREAQQNLSSINFGSKIFYAHVKPHVFDQHVPARRWARQVFEALECNRERFADPDAPTRLLAFVRCDHNVRLRPIPRWAYAAGQLPLFGQSSAKQWAALSREMLREEVPQLEKHPDWESVTRRFEHLKSKDGVVRNKILDAIGSALCSLAREKLPKFAYPNSATGKR